MKRSLFSLLILSVTYLYGLNEASLTRKEIEYEKQKVIYISWAQKAEYDNEDKEILRQKLRKFPHAINSSLNNVPYFIDIAYRNWWHVFELLLEEQENKESPCDIYTDQKDKYHNNLLHILTQTNTPPHILERTCKLFPHLLYDYNNEKKEYSIPLQSDKSEQGDSFILTYSVLTPLELLLITKKDPWVDVKILLQYGAQITDIVDFFISNGEYPQTTQIIKQYAAQLNTATSLSIPRPVMLPRKKQIIIRTDSPINDTITDA